MVVPSIWYTSDPSPDRGQDFPKYLFPEAYFLGVSSIVSLQLQDFLGWNMKPIHVHGGHWVSLKSLDVSNSCNSMDCSSSRLLCPLDSPGKNTGVGCQFLLQRIFLIQGSNLGLPHCRQILYHLHHQGGPCTWKARTDQIKSQSTPNQYMPDLKSKGTYMKALPWVTSRWVDPHTHPPEY